MIWRFSSITVSSISSRFALLTTISGILNHRISPFSPRICWTTKLRWNNQKTEAKLQELVSNENLHYLNDLTLDNRILPQVQMKLPPALQIRLTLNKHENISHFKDIAVPSLLLIDENDKPVFCFRCNLEHLNLASKSKQNFRRMDKIETHFPLNKIGVKLSEPKLAPESNNEEKSESEKQGSSEKAAEAVPEKFESDKKPKLVPNFSINPAMIENIR